MAKECPAACPRELIEKTIESSRSLILDLAPPILYVVGLEAALQSLADKLHERYGIERHIEDDGQPKPRPLTSASPAGDPTTP